MTTLHREFFWPDRRPIGILFAHSPDRVSAANPSGSLFPELGGMKNYIDRSLAVLKELDCQAVILWDGEGEEYPQYTGCPELAQPWVGDFSKAYRAAGYKFGMTARPLECVNRQWVTPKDHALALYRHAAYAREHFHAQLFYVDTPFEALGAGPLLDADVFKMLHKALPDCLVVPEKGNLAYGQWTAQYRELRDQHEPPTPSWDDFHAAVSGSFSMWNLSVDDPQMILDNADLLRGEIAKGSIMSVVAHWRGPCIDAVKGILAGTA